MSSGIVFDTTGTLIGSGLDAPSWGNILFEINTDDGTVSNIWLLSAEFAPQGMGFAPPTVGEQLADIRTEILDFYNSGDIFGPGDSGEGYQNSLLAKVDAAIAAWNVGDVTTMKNNLNALVNKISSPGALNHISEEARDVLIAKAELLIADL